MVRQLLTVVTAYALHFFVALISPVGEFFSLLVDLQRFLRQHKLECLRLIEEEFILALDDFIDFASSVAPFLRVLLTEKLVFFQVERAFPPNVVFLD